MATEKSQEWQSAEDTNTENASGWGQEVEAEVQIVLETEGDGFTGRLLEVDAPNRNGIVQAHIEKVYALTGEFIGDAFINAGRDLERKLRKVPANSEIRVQWTTSMDTGQKTPMRVYTVQWR